MEKFLMVLVVLPLFAFAQPDKADVVTLSTEGCYGTCPVYNLMLFADGTLIFNGQAHVKNKGISRISVSKDVFAQAIVLFKKYKFYEFQDAYLSKEEGDCKEEWSDNPTKTISVQYKGKIKTVSHDLGCRGFPKEQELLELEQQLYKHLNLGFLVGA